MTPLPLKQFRRMTSTVSARVLLFRPVHRISGLYLNNIERVRNRESLPLPLLRCTAGQVDELRHQAQRESDGHRALHRRCRGAG